MEVRANNGKGPLLFEWKPEIQTVNLIRKDMYYEVQLDEHSYCVREECPKYECKNKKSYN
ncbi:MAG: hypothetical protein LUJ25_06965 [Firmicutes bacterium]|nr:hypothetical protein [Bacillota bacterium]